MSIVKELSLKPESLVARYELKSLASSVSTPSLTFSTILSLLLHGLRLRLKGEIRTMLPKPH